MCPVHVLVRTLGNIVQLRELGAGLAQCHVRPLPITLTGFCQFLKARPQLAVGVPVVRVQVGGGKAGARPGSRLRAPRFWAGGWHF